MSDYLYVWNIHAFPAWAGPGAILLFQSRVGITFGWSRQFSSPLMVFFLRLSSPRELPLTCAPMCLSGLSLPYMFVALLHADMNSRGLLLLIFLNQKCFWQFDLQNTYFEACSWIFLYLIFLCSSGRCTSPAGPLLLRKLPFPRWHFSAMVARKLSSSFHPQHLKKLFS